MNTHTYIHTQGLMDDSQLTVTGKSIGENLKNVPPLTPGQKVKKYPSPLPPFLLVTPGQNLFHLPLITR